MARKVKWTQIAWGDLEEVSDYIAKDSHYYAAGFGVMPLALTTDNNSQFLNP